ncbi:MAG: DUF1631 family protein [Polaromonas sp.]|nr:MAG: DUF1631 family protein [Polaromonas sp.]
MAAHDVLNQCLQYAANACSAALGRCVDGAVAALQLAENQSIKVAERDTLSQSWRQLQNSKPTWLARYPVDMLAAFASGLASGKKTGASATPDDGDSRRSASMGLDAFSLVDDADVVQSIEKSRLLQTILPMLEQSLAELDTLMSSAQGLPNVQPECNPLRPEVFTQTLQALLRQATTEPAMLSSWSRHLAAPLGRELKLIYEKTITMLEAAQVPAAQYRVLQTPASASNSSYGRAGSDGKGRLDNTQQTWQQGPDDEGLGAFAEPPQYADLSSYEIRHELFQNFLFHGGSNAHHGLAPSYYSRVDEELAALKAAPDSTTSALDDMHIGQQELPVVDRPARFVDVSSQLSPQVWGAYGRSRERAMVRTQLKKEAVQVGQVLGLEVVRKLVSQVAQDPRLLVPVREAIVALEPSLLRLAMVDPRFFSDEGHAGRRLIERVAQRSFKYNDEYSAEFASFFEPVSQAFNELNARTIDDVQPFAVALATLEHAWDEQDQQTSQNRRSVVQALRFAEERQEKADQIAFDMSARSDLGNVPGVVMDFLFGPWALAMAHARLTDQRNQIDPQGFGSVVPDLLWSVKRDVTLKQPAKLIAMIPGLLEKLHAGLALLGQGPRENEPFFEALMTLHQPVLRLRRLKTQRDAQESSAMSLEAELLPATPEQRQVRPAEQPWLGREELDAAGFEDTQPSEPGALVALLPLMDDLQEAHATPLPVSAPATEPPQQLMQTSTHPATDTASEPLVASTAEPVCSPLGDSKAQAQAVLSRLHAGHWVDLYSKRRWLRAQLIWASTKGTLFMFLSHGGQPHSMTRRSCEKLIMQRWLRPVDAHGVVAQALQVMAAEATATPTQATRVTDARQTTERASETAQHETETV